MDAPDRLSLAFGDPGLSDLARLPASEWPSIAIGWCNRGFESAELIRFAELRPEQAAEDGELDMPGVLRSIGLPIRLIDPFSIAEVSGFAARGRAGLTLIQQDLNRTGYARFVFELRDTSDGGELPQLIPSIVGFGHGGTSYVMTADMDDEELIGTAAESVSDTLLEWFGSWPRCSRHQGPRLLRPFPPDPALPTRGTTDVSWWCWADQPHLVQPVGQLVDAYGTTRS